MDALQMLEELKKLDLEAIASESLTENAELMADLNAAQMAQGIKSDSTQILPKYRPLTIQLKKGRSGLSGITDRVTLHDTGAFYQNLYAEVQGDMIEFGSHDSKSAKLEKKYSTRKGSIFGLTEDNKEELIDGGLAKSWQQKITEQTGLTF